MPPLAPKNCFNNLFEMSQKEKLKLKNLPKSLDLKNRNHQSILGSRLINNNFMQFKALPEKSTFSTVMKKRAKVN